MIDARELIGRKLARVATSWHWFPGAEPSMLHMWLHLEGLGPVRFHTPGDGLDLRIDEPHGPYDMDEYGHVTVEDDPPAFPVTGFVGQSVVGVREVRNLSFRCPVGIRLFFSAGSVRIVNLADELVLSLGYDLGPVERILEEVSLTS